MLFGGNSLEWWDTPLSSGYKDFLVTEGRWKRDEFVVRIDCIQASNDEPELWECTIRDSVWVRVVADEFVDQAGKFPALPPGPFRAPFYRIAESMLAPLCEKFLRETGSLRTAEPICEYLIASAENQVHFIAMKEPSFTRLSN